MRKAVPGSIVAIMLFGAAALAPAAQAAPCDGVGMQQPFLDWHDSASYVLVDGGDFETAATGWTLSDGAATVPGGNPYRADSSATALSLPAGSSATSPAVCVSKGNPAARVFAQAGDASKAAKSRFAVDVLYLNADGAVRKVKKAGKLRAAGSWHPTRKFSLAQGQFHAKPDGTHGPPDGTHGPPDGTHGPTAEHGHGHGPSSGGATAQIQLRFKPVNGAGVLLDDVFVDPRMRL